MIKVELLFDLWKFGQRNKLTPCNHCKKDTTKFEGLCGACGEEK